MQAGVVATGGAPLKSFEGAASAPIGTPDDNITAPHPARAAPDDLAVHRRNRHRRLQQDRQHAFGTGACARASGSRRAGTRAGRPAPAAYTPPSAEQLYQLVAPIALYPDKLVAQVLAGATYPDQITAAHGWLAQNASSRAVRLRTRPTSSPGTRA